LNESGIAVAHFENPRTFDCSPISPTQAKGGLEWATLPTPNCPTQANIGLEWAAPSTPPTQANTGLEWATSSPTQAKIGLEWATPPDWLEETQHHTLDDALKSLKQGVSRRLIGKLPLKPKSGLSGPQHFWQKRYYDFNIRNYPQFVEKLKYIHRNPVRAGLCERPEDWEWSSFRHYATGCEGRVEIESETARKRERAAGRLCSAVELPHSSQRRA
jgi:hypothetical protein